MHKLAWRPRRPAINIAVPLASFLRLPPILELHTSAMSLAPFVTHAVSTTVIDQVLEEGMCQGARYFFIAEPQDVCPLERCNTEGTKTPIPQTWQSNFLDRSPEQCANSRKALAFVPFDEGDSEELRNSSRFAILDERFTQSGELLACNREEEGSVTSLRMKPAVASSCLEIWYSDQWEDALQRAASRNSTRISGRVARRC